MKKLFVIVFLFGCSQLGLAQQPTSVRLVIRHFDNDLGSVRVGMYHQKETWMGKTPIHADTIIYNREEVVLVFKGLAAGNYAISLYHDKNDNGKLDTNVFGIPTEPYAFSNNARGMFGPASFEDALFAVSGTETIHIIQLN